MFLIGPLADDFAAVLLKLLVGQIGEVIEVHFAPVGIRLTIVSPVEVKSLCQKNPNYLAFSTP